MMTLLRPLGGALAVGLILFAGRAHLRYINSMRHAAERRAKAAEESLGDATEKIETLESQMKLILAEVEKQREDMVRVSKEQQAASTDMRKIKDVFARHDFRKLLEKKPGLVSRVVNRGTRRILGMFECASTLEGCPEDPAPSEPSGGDNSPGSRADPNESR